MELSLDDEMPPGSGLGAKMSQLSTGTGSKIHTISSDPRTTETEVEEIHEIAAEEEEKIDSKLVSRRRKDAEITPIQNKDIDSFIPLKADSLSQASTHTTLSEYSDIINEELLRENARHYLQITSLKINDIETLPSDDDILASGGDVKHWDWEDILESPMLAEAVKRTEVEVEGSDSAKNDATKNVIKKSTSQIHLPMTHHSSDNSSLQKRRVMKENPRTSISSSGYSSYTSRLSSHSTNKTARESSKNVSNLSKECKVVAQSSPQDSFDATRPSNGNENEPELLQESATFSVSHSAVFCPCFLGTDIPVCQADIDNALDEQATKPSFQDSFCAMEAKDQSCPLNVKQSSGDANPLVNKKPPKVVERKSPSVESPIWYYSGNSFKHSKNHTALVRANNGQYRVLKHSSKEYVNQKAINYTVNSSNESFGDVPVTTVESDQVCFFPHFSLKSQPYYQVKPHRNYLYHCRSRSVSPGSIKSYSAEMMLSHNPRHMPSFHTKSASCSPASSIDNASAAEDFGYIPFPSEESRANKRAPFFFASMRPSAVVTAVKVGKISNTRNLESCSDKSAPATVIAPPETSATNANQNCNDIFETDSLPNFQAHPCDLFAMYTRADLKLFKKSLKNISSTTPTQYIQNGKLPNPVGAAAEPHEGTVPIAGVKRNESYTSLLPLRNQDSDRPAEGTPNTLIAGLIEESDKEDEDDITEGSQPSIIDDPSKDHISMRRVKRKKKRSLFKRFFSSLFSHGKDQD